MSDVVAGVQWPKGDDGRPLADWGSLADAMHRQVRALDDACLCSIARRVGLASSAMAGRAFLHEAVSELGQPLSRGLTRLRWDDTEYLVSVGDSTSTLACDLLVALDLAGLC
jgi:hypothetical protein